MERQRREKGTGNVRQRPDGRWEARRTFEGKLYTAYSSESGTKGRNAALAKLQAKVDEAKLREAQGLTLDVVPTVADYVAHWTEQQAMALRAGRIRKNTYDQRVWAVSYLVDAVGRKPLDKVTTADMNGLMDRLLAKGKAPATVHHVIRHAFKLFAQAVNEGRVRRNPVTEKPKVELELPDTLSDAETACVLGELRGTRYGVAFTLQAVTGLRTGELLALDEEHVVLPESGPGVVIVEFNWSRTEDGWGLGKPKTRRGSRQVPIPESMVALLRGHVEKVRVERAESEGLWPDDTALFVREDGIRPDVQRFSKLFKKALKACGISSDRKLTPHSLRHGFVTKALVAGWSPAQVAALAGHSAAVSMNRYLGAVSAAEVAGITEVTSKLLEEPS